MITKLYICTIIYFLFSVISITFRFTKYTARKEGAEIGKLKTFIWGIEGIFNLRILLVALIPVVNIILAMFFLFIPDEKLDDMYDKCKEEIKEEK